MKNKTGSLWLAFVMAFASVGLANGEQPIPRISFVDGEVSMQEGGETGWSAVDVNLPVQQGDRLVLDRDGLVEIEMDDGSYFRLNQFTDLIVLGLDERAVTLELREGELIVRVAGNTDCLVRTRQGEVALRTRGLYRVNSAQDGTVEVLVREGRAEFIGERVERSIRSGRRLLVTPDGEKFVMGEVDRVDSFDNWSDRRDARYASAKRSRYLPQDVRYGHADLDYHGRWVHLHDHGYCWAPTVYINDWAPYRYGYWRYTRRWGWTWVSYDPWGWLPYHYGRWHHDFRFGWVWMPGSYWGRGYWSPGLVRFGMWNGYVGWLPLGPGDYYGWGRHRGVTINQLNVQVNYVNLANRRHHNAVTYVRAEEFQSGRPIGTGVYSRNAATRGGARTVSGFQPERSVAENLFRRDNIVREAPKVDPARGGNLAYARERTAAGVRRDDGGAAGTAGRRVATADSGGSVLVGRGSERTDGPARNEPLAGGGGRVRTVGERGDTADRGQADRTADRETDGNRGRPGVSQGGAQDSSRSRGEAGRNQSIERSRGESGASDGGRVIRSQPGTRTESNRSTTGRAGSSATRSDGTRGSVGSSRSGTRNEGSRGSVGSGSSGTRSEGSRGSVGSGSSNTGSSRGSSSPPPQRVDPPPTRTTDRDGGAPQPIASDRGSRGWPSNRTENRSLARYDSAGAGSSVTVGGASRDRGGSDSMTHSWNRSSVGNSTGRVDVGNRSFGNASSASARSGASIDRSAPSPSRVSDRTSSNSSFGGSSVGRVSQPAPRPFSGGSSSVGSSRSSSSYGGGGSAPRYSGSSGSSASRSSSVGSSRSSSSYGGGGSAPRYSGSSGSSASRSSGSYSGGSSGGSTGARSSSTGSSSSSRSGDSGRGRR